MVNKASDETESDEKTTNKEALNGEPKAPPRKITKNDFRVNPKEIEKPDTNKR